MDRFPELLAFEVGGNLDPVLLLVFVAMLCTTKLIGKRECWKAVKLCRISACRDDDDQCRIFVSEILSSTQYPDTTFHHDSTISIKTVTTSNLKAKILS